MTSAVESVIKMINKRVKGSEKFWSEAGAEAILQLRADYLSETETMSRFWLQREAQARCLFRNWPPTSNWSGQSGQEGVLYRHAV